MTFLPDVLVLGSFPIDIRTLTGILGIGMAFLLAGWTGWSRLVGTGSPDQKVASSAADLILNLAVGGFLGAKLIYIAADPAAYIANPGLLLLFPFGPLALTGAAIGGTVAVILGLWRRPDRLAILDQAALPLAIGITLAMAGYKAPGGQAYFLLLGAATLGAVVATRFAPVPGHRAANTLVLVSAALVLGDLARPVIGGAGGVTGLQITAALLGTAAWFWTGRETKS